jgi:hypothetical protein
MICRGMSGPLVWIAPVSNTTIAGDAAGSLVSPGWRRVGCSGRTAGVVPVGADDLKVISQRDDIYVVSRMAIVGWLRARRLVLDEATITRIFATSRRSTTWR